MEADITEFQDFYTRSQYAPPSRLRTVERWLQEQACHEYALYVDRRLPVGSADGWKESASPYGKRDVGSYRRRNVLRWVENEARKTEYAEALSQKKATLRKRWGLYEWQDITPKKRWDSKIEPRYTGMFANSSNNSPNQ